MMTISKHDHGALGFRAACELFDVGYAIMERNLRRRYGSLSNEAIAELMAAWLRARPGAETGDSPGRPLRHPEAI